MEFADVKNDIAFRKIFGNENRKETLVSFLNAVLDFRGEQAIVDVKILNPYQLPKLRSGKVTIVDVKATDQVGRSYIVEMQVGQADGFAKRVLYYFSKSYGDQIKRGDFYRKLKPVIFIGILDYVFSNNPKHLSRHRIMDVETHEHLLQDVEFNFIELSKFNKPIEQLETLAEKWVYFIKNAENLSIIPDNVDDEGLKSAYHEANMHTWTAEELEAYDYTFMREEDERAKFDKAMQIAVQEAEQRGEKKNQIAMAKKAIVKGMDDETVADLTGLSMDEVARLRREVEQDRA